MSRPLAYRTAARAEFDRAFDWYDRQRPGLGVRFATAVETRLKELTVDPERYPIVYRDVREAPVTGFPYCVYYVAEPTHIQVLSVFHTSRNPVVWKRRRSRP